MIIIEGPDNAGKSMLAEKLCKELGVPVIHSVRPGKDWTADDTLYHSTKQLMPTRAILDRVYAVSEYVYGRIIRGKTALEHRHSEALMDFYYRPYLTIYCRPDMDTILANGDRDQMEGVIDNHRAIVEEYDLVFEEISQFTTGTILKYNWKTDNLNNLIGKCQKYLTKFNSKHVSSEYMTRFRDKQPQENQSQLSKVNNWNDSKLKGAN